MKQGYHSPGGGMGGGDRYHSMNNIGLPERKGFPLQCPSTALITPERKSQLGAAGPLTPPHSYSPFVQGRPPTKRQPIVLS